MTLMIKYICFGLISASGLLIHISVAQTPPLSQFVNLSKEEQLTSQAKKAIPYLLQPLQNVVDAFNAELNSSSNLSKTVELYAQKLWQQSKIIIQTKNDADDRRLYWARLTMLSLLKQQPKFLALTQSKQQKLITQFEYISRGSSDIQFSPDATIKIIVTGFDPFFLHRHIDQSNPSGVSALMLDGKKVIIDNKIAQIESLVVPVRFKDFDQGMIEDFLTPYVSDQSIDYIFTISMGRDEFDLERFPGLRRSAKAPDNLSVYTGANKSNPIKPKLNNKTLNGEEFVEFSLPVKRMQQAKTHYKVNDNKKVTLLDSNQKPKSIIAKSLSELSGKISVEGSGGGYLSNEISYRSVLLRNQLRPSLPIGHIHTPRIAAFEPKTSIIIYQDILAMIEAVVKTHKD